jgi:hypothetical protein
MNIIAMTHTEGTLLTVAIIVIIVLVCGVLVVTDDMDWFD